MPNQSILLEISLTFSGTPVRNDYGVPGSPVWYSVEDEKLHDISIGNHIYTAKEFKAKFGEAALDFLHNVGVEELDSDDWE